MPTQDEATRAIGHLITEWVIQLRGEPNFYHQINEIDDANVVELAAQITDYVRREGGIAIGDETGG